MNKRFIPFVMGVGSLALAVYLLFSLQSGWRYLIVVPLFAFGWPSIKTALFASNKEISELTGQAPMSDETKQNFEDQL